jgi:GH24 family phage-related lysozyme (muramidase)
MRTSVHGLTSILAEEAVILSTYRDSGGVLTLGAGHTDSAGPPKLELGMKINLKEAFNIFRGDIAKYENEVSTAVGVPLTQNQFDALVSWHYNTGAIRKATLTEKLNAKDYPGAAKEFARWNKSNGKVLRGLIDRRERETAIFTDAHYEDRPIVVRETESASPTTYTPDQVIEMLGGLPNKIKAEEDQTTEELLANPASRLLPKYRPQQSEEITHATLAKFAYLIPADRRNDKVCILAVRGYESKMGSSGENDRNIYDDALFVIEPAGVHSFNANTDPSRFKPGIAVLKAPQAVRYVPGLHGYSRVGGPYPAFRQDSDVTVIRDRSGEETDSDRSRFWINLHRGGNTDTSSAGCQTVPPHQWNEFKVLVDSLLANYRQQNFYYVLVEQGDVPSEQEIPEPSKAADEDTKVAKGSDAVPLPPRQALTGNPLLLLILLLIFLSKEKSMTSPALESGIDPTKQLLLLLLQSLLSGKQIDTTDRYYRPPHLFGDRQAHRSASTHTITNTGSAAIVAVVRKPPPDPAAVVISRIDWQTVPRDGTRRSHHRAGQTAHAGRSAAIAVVDHAAVAATISKADGHPFARANTGFTHHGIGQTGDAPAARNIEAECAGQCRWPWDRHALTSAWPDGDTLRPRTESDTGRDPRDAHPDSYRCVRCHRRLRRPAESPPRRQEIMSPPVAPDPV